MQEENANSGGKQGKNECSDKSQIVIGNDNRVNICRKGDETFQPDYLCKQKNQWRRYLTKVDAAKYVDILDSCLWLVIARHFPDDNYCLQDEMLLFIELSEQKHSWMKTK